VKTVKALDSRIGCSAPDHLKTTCLRLCLLLNFGKPRLEIKRVVHNLSTALNYLHS
jgi:hypothetical protein